MNICATRHAIQIIDLKRLCFRCKVILAVEISMKQISSIQYHHTQRLTLVITVAISLALAGMHVFAADQTTVQVTVEPIVADVCPNIGGVQSSIPEGMLVDSGGNCYTPATPPQPPEPVDLCSNLTGVQTILPDGYYRVDSGQCYLQPPPPAAPTDVCMNLDGIQASVPTEHYLNPSNECIPLPIEKDICTNIPGIQNKIPENMQVQSGRCYTPGPPAGYLDNSPNSQSTMVEGEKLKNVPDVLQPAAKALVEALPQETVQFFQAMPQKTAQDMPKYVFVLAVVLIIVPLLQAGRETIFHRQILAILKKERSIAEQKDNFIALASHYLRTPLTVMRNGLDMMISINEVTAEDASGVSNTLSGLDEDISQVLKNLEQNTSLKEIQLPPEEKVQSVLTTINLWGPITASLILTIVANFLIGVVGNKEISTNNALLQVLIVATFVLGVYILVRNIIIQKHLKERTKQLIEHEKTIDNSRNTLISQQTEILKNRLDDINREKLPLETAPSYHIFEDGYMRFARMLEKFLLLGQIQTGANRTVQEFNLRDAVEQVLFNYQSDLAAKDIRVINATSNSTVTQNEVLFNFVLNSLIDNAIKFNKEGGVITISSNPRGQTVKLEISDNGIGIDNDKLDQLFKPFSRAGSAIEFNYEGLGFSLFLNKLIMEYTGGSIAAEVNPAGGTRMLVDTPVRVSL